MIRQHTNKFSSFIQYSNCEDNTGYIKFVAKEGHDNMNLPLTCKNDLWYHVLPAKTYQEKVAINRISAAALYKLWHQRTVHAGSTILQKLHQHAKGVPKLKGNVFYQCPSCMSGKLSTKRNIKSKGTKTTSPKPIKPGKQLKGQPGQHFHIDFGFVRGQEDSYDIKNDNLPQQKGKIVKSIDGFNCYVIVVDRITHYTWIFLAQSKHPPILTIENLLNKFKSENPHRTVRTDQGGELGGSSEFAQMIAQCRFALELTGSNSSSQNGLAERPNRTYGQMMQCMLHSAELGPEFWSYALIHAVAVRNKLWYSSINKLPYEAMTGNKPDLSSLRIFGCRVFAKKPRNRSSKLDHHSSKGIFLGYSATNKTIQYIDEDTGMIKLASHVIYDEACMTLPSNKIPISARTLQILGYESESIHPDPQHKVLQIQQLNKQAIIPSRATDESVGYDLHSNLLDDITIAPGQTAIIPTGITIKPPEGTFGRIAPRSGLTIKKDITTLAGIIDPDYRGDIKVVLRNFGNEKQVIEKNSKIAQLIIKQVATLNIIETDLEDTKRGDSGFGSSDDIDDATILEFKSNHNSKHQPKITVTKVIQAYFEPITHIYMSNDPYTNITSRQSDDTTLGLILHQCPIRNLPKLMDCKKGSSAIRIPLWRSQLRNAYITHVNNSSITTIDQITSIIKAVRVTTPNAPIKFTFATLEQENIHPEFGTPSLNHEQMNIIGKHLWEISHSPAWNKNVDDELVAPIVIDNNKPNQVKRKYMTRARMKNKLPLIKTAVIKRPKKLTRRYLIQQDDWDNWRKSEHKQLDQYHNQGTLSKPTKLPKGANLLPLLWTYLVKDDGTKKARCVCNGSPRMQGSITLANTYTGSLEQICSRIFWATSAIHNHIVIGADASNAFAEAPAPKAPLYVTIDKPYREWYKCKYPHEEQPSTNNVLPVHGALQGHPEAARLWSKLINKIIKNLGLKASTHEPCLYSTNNYKQKGKTVLFLRQVDNFAVSCEDEETAKEVISKINSKMTIDVKYLGQISRYNGVDVLQSRNFIKIYNRTYIDKIGNQYSWLNNSTPLQEATPTPMIATPQFRKQLETTEPASEEQLKILERKYGFSYRKGIGELIYAMVTCRPNISYPIIKLSQYSVRPAEIHFQAVQQIYKYLWQTKDRGTTYWRKQQRMDLPEHNIPQLITDGNYDYSESKERQVHDPSLINAAVDSDYAGDTTHCKSVTGLSIQMAGGTILYKTRFQDTIALLSTEAKFNAAAEAGKYILYVRSILQDINLEQTQATTLYKDNQGALLMANAQQPTKQTRHMAVKNFAIQEWCEKDLIILHKIHTTHNWADSLTKAHSKILFYRHMNHILGVYIPEYSRKMLGLASSATSIISS